MSPHQDETPASPPPGGGAQAGAREQHEETVNDRWIGALLESQRLDTPEAIDARVAGAMRRVRAWRAPALVGAQGATGAEGAVHGPDALDARDALHAPDARHPRNAAPWRLAIAGSLRGPRAWWRAPVAAAAALAAVVAVALLFDPRPASASASASALVRAAQASEAKAGDRSFTLRLLPPGPELSAEGGTGRPDAASVRPPTVRGRVDIRDAQHVRLEMELPDGKRVVRVVNGNMAWEQRPDGGIYRVPMDRAMPRWIETDDGSVMVEQLENLLTEINDDYAVERRPAGAGDGMRAGMVRVAATRRSSDERGPAKIDLWIDSTTGIVQRAVLAWNREPRPGAGDARGAGDLRGDGPPPRDGQPPRDGPPVRNGAFSRDGAMPRDGAPLRDGTFARDGAPPRDGMRPRDQAPPRPPAPGKLVIDRIPTDSFPANYFTPPERPREAGPPGARGERDGRDAPARRGGPDERGRDRPGPADAPD